MRVTIMGTGAMACYFGSRLASVAEVALVGTWNEGLRALRARGIDVRDAAPSAPVPVRAVSLGEPAPPAELVIILVKSWQTARVAPHVNRYLASGGSLLTLQNGIGNLELLGEGACLGVTTQGAMLMEPAVVCPAGKGLTVMAAPGWIADLFRSAGLSAETCDASRARSLLWGKLVVNCGINALTAILRVPNGTLLERPGAAALMDRAAAECAAVARTLGIELSFPDPVARTREVALLTSANRSSMLQDVLRGAPTECDAINGAVAREGARLGVPVPVNTILTALVSSLTPVAEASDKKKSMNAGEPA